jgi:hypothetical protein
MAHKHDADAEFQSALRAACLKAAGVGAVSALIGVIPGAGIILRFTLGEVGDMAAVSAIQEQLIEDTLKIYGLPLPAAIRKPLLVQISAIGAGASVSIDAIGRGMLARYGSRIGGSVFSRVVPLAAVLTSAIGNATTTYAIGRRAQAFAKLRDTPVDGLGDALRAFSGVDERKVWEWSVAATRETIGRFAGVLKRFKPGKPETAENAQPAPKKPSAKRSSVKKTTAKKTSAAKSARKRAPRKPPASG